MWSTCRHRSSQSIDDNILKINGINQQNFFFSSFIRPSVPINPNQLLILRISSFRISENTVFNYRHKSEICRCHRHHPMTIRMNMFWVYNWNSEFETDENAGRNWKINKCTINTMSKHAYMCVQSRTIIIQLSIELRLMLWVDNKSSRTHSFFVCISQSLRLFRHAEWLTDWLACGLASLFTWPMECYAARSGVCARASIPFTVVQQNEYWKFNKVKLVKLKSLFAMYEI